MPKLPVHLSARLKSHKVTTLYSSAKAVCSLLSPAHICRNRKLAILDDEQATLQYYDHPAATSASVTAHSSAEALTCAVTHPPTINPLAALLELSNVFLPNTRINEENERSEVEFYKRGPRVVHRE